MFGCCGIVNNLAKGKPRNMEHMHESRTDMAAAITIGCRYTIIPIEKLPIIQSDTLDQLAAVL